MEIFLFDVAATSEETQVMRFNEFLFKCKTKSPYNFYSVLCLDFKQMCLSPTWLKKDLALRKLTHIPLSTSKQALKSNTSFYVKLSKCVAKKYLKNLLFLEHTTVYQLLLLLIYIRFRIYLYAIICVKIGIKLT